MYWPPLYAYVRRRVGDVNEAQDLTQAFFARLLEKESLQQAAPERGRFRAFLITAFKHFLANEWKKAKAHKRGGGRRMLSLNFAREDSAPVWEPAEESTAEQIYDRRWAVTLLNRVMLQLQQELEASGQGEQFQALKPMLVARGETSAAPVAARLGLSEPAARMAASRLRKRYRELLRTEIAQTVAVPEAIDEEIRDLFGILSR